jgi:hypothetical protein
MVISHRHRYVFVQTMKTASSAIAAELCENYSGEMILHKHASYKEYLAQASGNEKQYFSFAGVRNPLDVAVSRYELRKSESGEQKNLEHRAQSRFAHMPGVEFNQFFVEFVLGRGADIGSVPLTWRNENFQSLSFIYKYENLQQDFSEILAVLGITQRRLLPMLNKTKTKDHFFQYYDKPTLRLAYAFYAEYLLRWGYDLPLALRLKIMRNNIRSTLRKLKGRL